MVQSSFVIVERDDGELTGARCPPSRSVRFRKDQRDFTWSFHRLRRSQACPPFGKVPAENSSNVKQRAAAAYHAHVMWAVADDITFRAQDSILQRDSIQDSSPLPRIRNTRTIHHRTSRNLGVILPFPAEPLRAYINLVTVSSKDGALVSHRQNPRTLRRSFS